MRTVAIILSAGTGKRMNSSMPKQYMLLKGKPILYYTIKAFEASEIEDIILVTGVGDEEYCRRELVEKYNFKKVRAIVPGGKERYHSVYHGICEANKRVCDYIFIHDGARPFISLDVIKNALEQIRQYDACVVGVPVKDTIKISDAEGFVTETPKRERVYQIQTPQVFSYPLIRDAYNQLMENEYDILNQGIKITDDAMVVETMLNHKVKIIEGSYENIKITTPEDLKIAEIFVK